MKQQLFFHYEKLEIPNKGNIEMIKFRDIVYITYDKPYCTFLYMKGPEKKKVLFQVALAHVELNLPLVFFRCNTATIINFHCLKEINYSKNRLLMEDRTSFSLTRRKVQAFKERKLLLGKLAPVQESCLSCINSRYFQENRPPGISK